MSKTIESELPDAIVNLMTAKPKEWSKKEIAQALNVSETAVFYTLKTLEYAEKITHTRTVGKTNLYCIKEAEGNFI